MTLRLDCDASNREWFVSASQRNWVTCDRGEQSFGVDVIALLFWLVDSYSGDRPQALDWQQTYRSRSDSIWSQELQDGPLSCLLTSGRDGSKHSVLSSLLAEIMSNVQDDAMEDLRVQQRTDHNISQLGEWTEQGKELRASTVMFKGSELRTLRTVWSLQPEG